MSGKKREPVRVAEALAGYLARSGLGDRIEEAGAVDDWADRVGERIAAVTTPLRVNNGVLFVGVESSAWLMELRMMETEIRTRLNEGRESGRIRSIRFVQEGEPEEPPRPRGGRGRGGNIRGRRG